MKSSLFYLSWFLFSHIPVAQGCCESQRLGSEVAVNGQACASKGTAPKWGEIEAGSAIAEATSVALELQKATDQGRQD